MPSASRSADAMDKGCGALTAARSPGAEIPEPTCVTGSGRLSCNQILGPLGALCAGAGPAANAGVIRPRQTKTTASDAIARRRGATNNFFTASDSFNALPVFEDPFGLPGNAIRTRDLLPKTAKLHTTPLDGT